MKYVLPIATLFLSITCTASTIDLEPGSSIRVFPGEETTVTCSADHRRNTYFCACGGGSAAWSDQTLIRYDWVADTKRETKIASYASSFVCQDELKKHPSCL